MEDRLEKGLLLEFLLAWPAEPRCETLASFFVSITRQRKVKNMMPIAVRVRFLGSHAREANIMRVAPCLRIAFWALACNLLLLPKLEPLPTEEKDD